MWGVKASDESASHHFSYHELSCRHCDHLLSYPAANELAAFLEKIRLRFQAKYGRELIIHIDSAHRCPIHNAAVGGAPHSYHLAGQAADITVRGLSPEQVWQDCSVWQEEGIIGGVGRYPSFTHIDTGPRRSWDGP